MYCGVNDPAPRRRHSSSSLVLLTKSEIRLGSDIKVLRPTSGRNHPAPSLLPSLEVLGSLTIKEVLDKHREAL